MELISTSQPQDDESLGEEKKNIGAEKTFFAATLQVQAMTMLRTQVSKANGPWVQKKFLQTLTLFMTVWMTVDMVLDWIFCYKFYQMCQDNDRNFTDLDMDTPEYLNSTGPVSCVYWKASLGFILLPQALATLFMIVINTTDRPGCGEALQNVFLALLYPLSVPALSIYESGKLLFRGQDQTGTRAWRLFEHLGEAGPQLILMIIFTTNNGGPTVNPLWITSAVFSAGSFLFGISSCCRTLLDLQRKRWVKRNELNSIQ